MKAVDLYMEQDIVVVSKKLYEELIDDALFLDCLRAGGVDNWEWYDEAVVMYNEHKAK